MQLSATLKPNEWMQSQGVTQEKSTGTKQGKEKQNHKSETNSKNRGVLGILQMYTIYQDRLPICNSLV